MVKKWRGYIIPSKRMYAPDIPSEKPVLIHNTMFIVAVLWRMCDALSAFPGLETGLGCIRPGGNMRKTRPIWRKEGT